MSPFRIFEPWLKTVQGSASVHAESIPIQEDSMHKTKFKHASESHSSQWYLSTDLILNICLNILSNKDIFHNEDSSSKPLFFVCSVNLFKFKRHIWNFPCVEHFMITLYHGLFQ